MSGTVKPQGVFSAPSNGDVDDNAVHAVFQANLKDILRAKISSGTATRHGHVTQEQPWRRWRSQWKRMCLLWLTTWFLRVAGLQPALSYPHLYLSVYKAYALKQSACSPGREEKTRVGVQKPWDFREPYPAIPDKPTWIDTVILE